MGSIPSVTRSDEEEGGGNMRFFGVVSGSGVDPFSLVQSLDRFREAYRVQPTEPFMVYESDPNCAVVACWGTGWSGHVVTLPDRERMVQDYLSHLLVAERFGRSAEDRDLRLSSSLVDAEAKGGVFVPLVCCGCPE